MEDTAHSFDLLGIVDAAAAGFKDFDRAYMPLAPASSASEQERQWEFCRACDTATEPRAQAVLPEFVCPACNQVFEAPMESFDNEQVSMVRSAPQLRVVGPESSRHQRALDRSSTTDYATSQRSSLLRELIVMNDAYKQAGGNPFSPQVLEQVVLEYEQVRDKAVIRSLNKLAILATLIYVKSAAAGSIREKADAARMLGLETEGLSRGDGLLRVMHINPEELNRPVQGSWIETTFSRIGLLYVANCPPSDQLQRGKGVTDVTVLQAALTREDGQIIKELKLAVGAVLARCQQKHLGINTQPKTQVVGATYAVLRRAKLPAHWGWAGGLDCGATLPAAVRGSLDWMAAHSKIRKNTIQMFVKVLCGYHSRFEDVYRAHKLSCGRFESLGS